MKKSLIVEKECFNESRLSFKDRVEQASPISNNETSYKRKGPGHKSISTISFSKDNPHSTHKIVPKKINIFKLEKKVH